MSQQRQICTFLLGDRHFGLDVLAIQEIVREQPLTRVPLAHRMVVGLMNLRGQIVTALDLRRRLDLPDRDPGCSPVNVVVRTDDGAVALLVDEIGDVLTLTDTDFERPPETMSDSLRELILGAYKLADRLVVILSPERVVSVPGTKG
jgi:purine-binding chemotaxis protein CheW